MFSLRVLLNFCINFGEFQPDVAYESVGYKKEHVTQHSRWKLFSQMFIHAQIKNLSYLKQIQQLLEQKNYSKEKSMSKKYFSCFCKKFINRMNGGYEMIWKLCFGNKLHKMKTLLL